MTSVFAKVIKKMKKGFQKPEGCEKAKTEDGHKALPFVCTQLTPELAEEARKKLNETEEVKEKALAEFRKLIANEKNFEVPDNEQLLMAFLRSRKFNVKKAFKLSQNFWNFRRENRRMYEFIDLGSAVSLIHRNFLGFLHYRDMNGCSVFILKVSLWNTEIDTFEDIFKVVSGILIYSLEYDATQIAGFRAIIDLRGLNWNHIKQLTPTNIIQSIRSTQFCFPARYKGIHVLSENKMLNLIWGMIYPLLTQKLKRRIFFHGEDLTPLTQFIHPSVLPEEFGGQGPVFDNDDWKDIIHSRMNGILSMLNYGYKSS